MKKTVSVRQIICVHTNLIRLKTVKKKVYLDKSRNHATMSFCAIFLKVILKPFFKRISAYMLLNFSNLNAAVLILSTKDCVPS